MLIFKCFYKVIVPLSHDGVRGWIFDLVCPGYAKSVSHKSLLLMKNATVNWNLGFNDDVCKEKQAIVAYNQDAPIFEVYHWYKNEVFQYSEMNKDFLSPYMRYSSMAREWEIQAAFFDNNNIQPIWLDAYYDWGTLNYTTGQWSGAVGMIQRDEADYAIRGFSFTYARSKVAAFSPGISYSKLHWFTRYPLELPPTWNLLGLFTKGHISQISFL